MSMSKFKAKISDLITNNQVETLSDEKENNFHVSLISSKGNLRKERRVNLLNMLRSNENNANKDTRKIVLNELETENDRKSSSRYNVSFKNRLTPKSTASTTNSKYKTLTIFTQNLSTKSKNAPYNKTRVDYINSYDNKSDRFRMKKSCSIIANCKLNSINKRSGNVLSHEKICDNIAEVRKKISENKCGAWNFKNTNNNKLKLIKYSLNTNHYKNDERW